MTKEKRWEIINKIKQQHQKFKVWDTWLYSEFSDLDKPPPLPNPEKIVEDETSFLLEELDRQYQDGFEEGIAMLIEVMKELPEYVEQLRFVEKMLKRLKDV